MLKRKPSIKRAFVYYSIKDKSYEREIRFS